MTVIITFYDLYHKSHQTVISGKQEEKIIGHTNRGTRIVYKRGQLLLKTACLISNFKNKASDHTNK